MNATCCPAHVRLKLSVALAALLLALPVHAAGEKGPRLEVRPERLDFGTMEHGAKRQRTLHIRNVGDAELVIEQIRPSCPECVVDRDVPGPLPPGARLDVPVSYSAVDVPGKHTAHLTFHSNDPVEPLKRVFLDITILKPDDASSLEVEPARIDLGIIFRRVVPFL